MKSKEVLKGHYSSRGSNGRNRFGISKQRGFRLRCFLSMMNNSHRDKSKSQILDFERARLQSCREIEPLF
jgi:hypothetical protein